MFSTETSLNFGTITSITESFLNIYTLLLILLIPLSFLLKFVSRNTSVINKMEEDDSLIKLICKIAYDLSRVNCIDHVYFWTSFSLHSAKLLNFQFLQSKFYNLK